MYFETLTMCLCCLQLDMDELMSVPCDYWMEDMQETWSFFQK